MPSWCSSEILLLTPLTEASISMFCMAECCVVSHPVDTEDRLVVYLSCPSWIWSSFGCRSPWGWRVPTGSFGGHVQGGSSVDATFLEALQIQPPNTVCTEPTSLSSSPYHGVTAWSTTGDRSRETRINSYQLPWRISMQEKGQWGWKIRQKLPAEQRWCVLETGVALRSVSSPPHPWPVSSLLMDSCPGRCLPPSQHTPWE